MVPYSDAETAPSQITMLVAEDDPLVRHAMAEALRDLGVCVVQAATGDEAWEFLTTGGAVDLVFTDHQMPGSLTGAQLAAKIRGRYPGLKVIITSADFVAGGSEAVLRKPYPLYETAADLAELAVKNKHGRADP
jgi:CheY-like chemotaxis protein